MSKAINKENLNATEELIAMIQEFKKAVIMLVLYIINADEIYIKDFSNKTDYKSLVEEINFFYKNDKASMSPENFKISGTNWDSIGYDYYAFAKGKNATKYLILSLQRVEKALSKIDKPKGFFTRKTLSFEYVKKKMSEFADKLKNEKKPLMKYSKSLLHVAGLKTERELERDEPCMRAAQADAAVREESIDSSAGSKASSLDGYDGRGVRHYEEDETETIEHLLTQGSATSASVNPPRSRVTEGGGEEEKIRESSDGSERGRRRSSGIPKNTM